MENSGRIRIMKFSLDLQIASIQYTETSVDFLRLKGDNNKIFTQQIKMRSARIIGLEWVAASQILFVTNQGFELYQVNAEKKSLKLLKVYNLSMYWYIYYADSQLIIASSGNGAIYRLAKFEVDFGFSDAKANLLEREVTVASLYGSLYLLVLRYSLRDSSTSDIAMYKLSVNGMETPALTDTLLLERTGAFGIHIIDNIVVVHHQTTNQSVLFDIRCYNKPHSGIVVHRPVIVASIKCGNELAASFEYEVPTYSQSWVMFYPNIVIDATIGLFTLITLHPESSEFVLVNKVEFLRFLYNRSSMKSLFLNEFRSSLFSNLLSLKEIHEIFDWIVKPLSKGTQASSAKVIGNDTIRWIGPVSKYSLIAVPYQCSLFTQSDVISLIFLPIIESQKISKKRLVEYALHYLLVLKEYEIEVQPYFLNEILVSAMASAGEFHRLQHCLQFRVITDTKQTAFQLLSHGAKHASLIQLALDMLVRLGTATEEIVEVFLARGHVVEAVRFLESTSSIDKVNPLKLLEAAWQQNRQIRYAVFSRIRSSFSPCKNKTANSSNSHHYEEYTKRFKELFSEEEIAEAKKDSQLAVVFRS
ncbi:unnamed protein product [Dracunculus medinensis]|uniref:Mic1 domain-containing protein n=1 Tax=Dracunculus medinensis TaxID=318479 RepID=A0A0N4U4R9_DRAME|nr:unnamed protein product [Dracunculus medinensis]